MSTLIIAKVAPPSGLIKLLSNLLGIDVGVKRDGRVRLFAASVQRLVYLVSIHVSVGSVNH